MTALGLYRVLRLSGDDVGEASEEGGVLSVPVSAPPVSCRCGCLFTSIGSGCGRRHRWG